MKKKRKIEKTNISTIFFFKEWRMTLLNLEEKENKV